MSLAARILEEKRTLIYPLAAALVVNAALFLAVVYPLSIKVRNGEASAQSAATTLAAARREMEAARNTVTGKVAADTELKKFYGEVLPADQSSARHLLYLKVYQLARKSNVTYERAGNDESQQKDSTLGKLTSTIVLSGQYRDIRRFVYDLETAPEFLILENVALSQADTASGLNVTVKVATYFQAGGHGI